MDPLKVLFITSSHEELGNSGRTTGVWLEEFATPYYLFREAGISVTIASTKGGEVPLDPKSQSIIVATQSTKRFLKDEEARSFLSDSLVLGDVYATDFDMVFLPGGYGPMWDLAENKISKKLLEDFCSQNKPIGAVSHGVVSLLALETGMARPFLKGRRITGASNNEVTSAGMNAILPFLLETKLFLLEALYSKGEDYLSYVVVDENIISGQNPASSAAVAKKMIALALLNQKPLYTINYQ